MTYEYPKALLAILSGKTPPIVANIIGPGIIAADMPTVKPRIRALVNSIMNPPRKLSVIENIESNYIKMF